MKNTLCFNYDENGIAHRPHEKSELELHARVRCCNVLEKKASDSRPRINVHRVCVCVCCVWINVRWH